MFQRARSFFLGSREHFDDCECAVVASYFMIQNLIVVYHDGNDLC